MSEIYKKLLNTSSPLIDLKFGELNYDNKIGKDNDLPRGINYMIKISKLSYGDTKFKDHTRCLIIPSMTAFQSEGLQNASLSEETIRIALLMWDFFDFPENSAIHYSLPFADELISLGIARQSYFEIEGNIGQALPESLSGLFRSYENKHPNTWSIFHDSRNRNIMEVGKNKTGLIRFTSCIPMPAKDVPFEEILLFKSKREPELLQLRNHIETIVAKVQNSGDGDVSIDKELNSFKNAAENHLRVAKESRIKFNLGDLSASFNILSPIAGGITSYLTELPITPGLIAGAVAGFGFSPSVKMSYNRIGATPLRYISRAHTELPWGR